MKKKRTGVFFQDMSRDSSRIFVFLQRRNFFLQKNVSHDRHKYVRNDTGRGPNRSEHKYAYLYVFMHVYVYVHG